MWNEVEHAAPPLAKAQVVATTLGFLFQRATSRPLGSIAAVLYGIVLCKQSFLLYPFDFKRSLIGSSIRSYRACNARDFVRTKLPPKAALCALNQWVNSGGNYSHNTLAYISARILPKPQVIKLNLKWLFICQKDFLRSVRIDS